jgi:hypothetical protein
LNLDLGLITDIYMSDACLISFELKALMKVVVQNLTDYVIAQPLNSKRLSR